MDATPQVFRALARSSPWRWTTLRFAQVRWPIRGTFDDGVRAWLRRPDMLRVESRDGDLIQVIQEGPDNGMLLTSSGPPISRMRPEAPELDADGLIREPRDAGSGWDHTTPMFQDYYWVALLDPVELADGVEGDGTAVEDVTVVQHHGRAALQATVVPTKAYDPLCSCCCLLYCEICDRRESASDADRLLDGGYTYAYAYRVHLDVQTGVCVHIEQLGGSWSGRRHDLLIEAVDETMADALFHRTSPHRW